MFDNLPIFSELPLTDRNILSLFCQERFLKAGEILFNEDDEGMAVYILKRGRLRIFKTADNHQEETVSIITESGTIIGEMALFDDTAKHQHMASVMAEEDSELIVISDSAIVDFALEHPALLTHIKELINKRKKMNL